MATMSEELTREEWQAGELWTKFVAWGKVYLQIGDVRGVINLDCGNGRNT